MSIKSIVISHINKEGLEYGIGIHNYQYRINEYGVKIILDEKELDDLINKLIKIKTS